MDWKTKAEKLKFEDGLSWSQVAIELKDEFPDLDLVQVKAKINRALRYTDAYKSRNDSKPVGVFSDIHAPFDHPNFPYFLRDTFKKYGVSEVICLGDIFDSHAISNHPPEPCALGAYSETDLAIQHLRVYTEMFPNVKYVKGNHDERIERQAAKVNIGRRYLKDLHEILELPATWECMGYEFIRDDVIYSHGINCGGKNGAINKAMADRMSCCIGHSHAFGGVQTQANSRDRIFGMNVGCGVNEDAYAFAYGRNSKYKSTLGCGIVLNKEQALFVPMGREYL